MSDPLARYIGRRYDAERYNCWHFFRQLQGEIFGVKDLPLIDAAAFDHPRETFRHHSGRRSWHPVATPGHGAGVLMRWRADALHIGCWLDRDGGGVLHNLRDHGVVFHSPRHLRALGLLIEGYYHYREAA